MKKRRRLKKGPVAILVITIVLFVFLIVSCCKKEEQLEFVEHKTPTFITNFSNDTNEGIDEKLKSTIIDFFDIYYLSLKELKEYNMMFLFGDEIEGYINQSAMHFLINYRNLQRTDLKLDNCSYSLKISKISKENDIITIVVLEDSIFNFNFMKNIDSKKYNVENTFVFKKEKEDYKIIKYEKNADFYNVIKANVSENPTKESILEVVKEALVLAASMLDNEKNYYEKLKEIPVKKCEYKYNRDKAVSYALSWITTRNPDYANLHKYGGNCQNYASQVLRSGGIPNDVSGYYRFKYYTSTPDESEESVGRTPSWAGVSQFYDYAKSNVNSKGLCSLVDINYYYGEKGDLIQFGYKDTWAHTSVITGIFSENGKMIDLLTSSNTTDRENFPLSAYNYPNKRLIKIYGWN